MKILLACSAGLICLIQPSFAQDAPSSELVETFENGVGMRLVLIKPGKFTMGSPLDEMDRGKDETPHEVQITIPFYMGAMEVTQKQWIEVMGSRPFGTKSTSSRKVGDNYPATEVDWEKVQEYCKKLSEKEGMEYKLPTDAQWEFACRAGRSTPYNHSLNRRYPWKEVWCYERIQALNEGRYSRHAREVGLLKPNKWGLYDMHGNVWEWCSDFYDAEYYQDSETFDPPGPEFGNDYRSIRGGSFDKGLSEARSANRAAWRKRSKGHIIGFRVIAVPGSENSE